VGNGAARTAAGGACKPEALSADEQNDFLALGARLPEIWQRPEVSRENKKALLRCLIDKVILHRVTRDRITIRVVWRGGEVSQLDVEPRVHAVSALSRSVEMEARLLELARQGIDDAAIAKILTEEGHRSARCTMFRHVPCKSFDSDTVYCTMPDQCVSGISPDG
jgi:hypothetical protein